MKRRAFPGHGPEVEAKYNRSAQWLLAAIWHSERAKEWCESNNVALKAQGEGIGSAGGLAVPVELSKAILDLRDAYGAFRRRARIVNMARDTMSVPRRATTGATATFVGENAGATETNVNIDRLDLTAKKISALIRISSELEEDSATDMVDYVANEIAFAFAATEDDCAFNADGSSTYGKMRGIGTIVLDGAHSKAKVTAVNNTFVTLTATDLANLMSAVRASAIPNAAWFCSQTCFAVTFCRLVGGGGAYMDNREIDGVNTPYYLGFPVILTQKLPLVTSTLTGKVMLAFGDMYAGGVLGQRRSITLARSADRYLDQDQIGILGTQRFHAAVHDVGDNTNAGAIAALVGS